jgi:nucleoid DNA-binding protein
LEVAASLQPNSKGWTHRTHDLPKKQALGLLADFVTAMSTYLKVGGRIRMSGLGILEVKTRAGSGKTLV